MRLILALTLITTNAIAMPNTYDTAQKVLDEVWYANRYENYNAKDFRPMAAGEAGNCARFAATYAEKMKAYGINATPLYRNLKDIGGHAVAITDDGIVLDVRSRKPKLIQEFMKE